ncbi:MAG: FecR domain-containing protein [Sphingobium sp.]|nr:FecR domain-containing protein [Sphingobium sp.]
MRQDEMAPADWHRFIEWLEADPRHAEAYDRLALADTALRVAPGQVVPAGLPEPANDRGDASWRWTRWIGGAAASAAAIGAVLVLRTAGPDVYAVETRAGETRQIALDEGSRVEVAGGSRLLLDRNNPRLVTLERGDALFHVRHDQRRPFAVRSGKLEVQDIGTVFNVTRDGTAFAVAVAEGSVLFQPRGEAVTLKAGSRISVREDQGDVRVDRIAPEMVGAWRTGRLTFANTPVPQVLHTIQRLYGTQLVANDGLSSRAVTGIITLSGEAKRDVPHIAALIGANWRADGERWILSPAEETKP